LLCERIKAQNASIQVDVVQQPVSTRFTQINDLYFPVDFTYRIGKTVERTILDQDSLVINEPITKDDFALEMPEDNWYYDSRTKIRYDPNVIE
jgi:hypothetical protein